MVIAKALRSGARAWSWPVPVCPSINGSRVHGFPGACSRAGGTHCLQSSGRFPRLLKGGRVEKLWVRLLGMWGCSRDARVLAGLAGSACCVRVHASCSWAWSTDIGVEAPCRDPSLVKLEVGTSVSVLQGHACCRTHVWSVGIWGVG